MKSHDVTDHKKPWVTPSLQVIPLQSAEGGHNLASSDAVGAHTNRPRS